jgi:hypothetical protein
MVNVIKHMCLADEIDKAFLSLLNSPGIIHMHLDVTFFRSG